MISAGVFHPHAGGAESLFRDLGRLLVREGHDVTVVTRRLEGTSEEEALDGFRILRLRYPLAYERIASVRRFVAGSPRVLARLWREIRRRRVGTVCVGLADMSALYFLLLRPFFRFRLVTYLHGGEVRDVPAASPHFNRMMRALLRASDAIVAVSDDLAEEARRFGEGIARKTTVIPNGIDLGAIDAAEPWQRPRPYVLYVGRLARDKNPLDVVRGWALAAPDLPGVDLVMVGDGDERAAVEALAADLGVSDRIELRGRRDRAEVPAAMKGARILVLASPAEGHPIAVLEALAAGTPVIAARVRGTVDTIEEGVTGDLFEPGDIEGLAARIRRYAGHPAALEALREGVAARDRSATDLERALPRHLEALIPPGEDEITILFPVLDQEERLLEDALESVLAQTSPRWRLAVGLDRRARPAVRERLERLDDPRVQILDTGETGFGTALNRLLRAATTPFAAILLSDDRLDPTAIETLLSQRRRRPDVDYFFSSRRFIDRDGERFGDVMPSRAFELAEFARHGSPVKHLMCWRRRLALEIGGMREHLGAHGCDDFDFPWRMAEAGATFFPVPECLYEYRVHTAGPRLTTHRSLQEQVDVLQTMFREHGVGEPRLAAFLDGAVDSYLVAAHSGVDEAARAPVSPVRFREAGPERRDDLHARGVAHRHFFPHRILVTPRHGPDGMYYAERMCGVGDPGALRQILLYARDEALEGLPPELFFDDEIVWHQQQLGLPGLIAHANLVLAGEDVAVTMAQSDLVQRVGRRREWKTRIEQRFKGWGHMLLHAALAYAMDRDARALLWPTSELVLRHCDQSRDVRPQLFRRIYDDVPSRYDPVRVDDWWRIDIADAREHVAALDRRIATRPRTRTVCIVHDIERGLGHADDEPGFVAEAERVSGPALADMLRAEEAAGVRATYCVVGRLLPELRERIEQGGHGLAFHSFEHAVWKPYPLLRRIRERLPDAEGRFQRSLGGVDYREMERCRQIDYRLKGYHPPQSRITPGLHDRHLALQNFEWLASSAWHLGRDDPWMENGVVKIPIHLDDYDLHRGAIGYAEWERQVGELLARADLETVVLGLHDCYGPTWLDAYPALLERLKAAGELRTLDEVAAEIGLGETRWC